MADICFIKTSSLGDVIHHMPALVDARRYHPDARLTWVVEENYAPLVGLHPGVDHIIPVSVRRWRKALHRASTWREIGAFVRTLRSKQFDAVVDTQGLMRSAVVARATRGVRHGYAWDSAREPATSLLYNVRHRVERRIHAVDRNRALTAQALGYTYKGLPDYGLDVPGTAEKPYAVLLHGSARPEKEWPETNWRTLIAALQQAGLEVRLPWGTDDERQRSERLAAGGAAQIFERQPLDAVARLIAGATLVAGLDTGLMHLAAALNVPLVAIFIGSDPQLTGPVGSGPIAVVGSEGKTPNADEVIEAARETLATKPSTAAARGAFTSP
jgi:heptosyltransferase-1